ncbi:LysE family translocator [Cohnella candidum]|uniref:LysE family translocator n=1 Tax=Cohnella candidum TaxID=2674991 RepID=A0A3G3K397_9BACL|nr:LysE family transporter [Cohnella candidum]AYQ74976.1 hypothetical protein EAV92_21910 [Cohnella candidum]
MPLPLFLKYFIFGISLAASIGPVNTAMIRQGVEKGFVTAWLVGVGGMAADFAIIVAIATGLGAVLTHGAIPLFVGCAGSLVLLYTGLQNVRHGRSRIVRPAVMDRHRVPAAVGSFLKGMLLASSNPMNFVFWLGIYGSLPSTLTPVSSIGSIFAGIAFTNALFAFAAALGKTFARPAVLRLIPLASGIVLIGYGVWTGYTVLRPYI